MFPSVNSRTSLIAALAALFILAAMPNPAFAQDAAAEEEGPSPEDQAKAQTLAKEGLALRESGEFVAAIEKFEEAFRLYPDALLQILIGDTQRQAGNNKAALEAWKKYLELDPGGQAAEQAKERIKVVEDEIAAAEKAAKEEKERLEKEEAARKAEEARKKKEEEEQLKLAVNAMVMTGLDQNATFLVRAFAGGLIRFGRFAPEAHIAFDGFIRTQENKGTRAQSFTLLDIGARYAFVDENFVGPFIAGGASFGIFAGRPRDVALENDANSCGGFADNNCKFEVNQLLTYRLGLGYGIRSGDKTTMAVRLDFTAYHYSVANNQPSDAGFAIADDIEKPQIALAGMLGLEFIRWR